MIDRYSNVSRRDIIEVPDDSDYYFILHQYDQDAMVIRRRAWTDDYVKIPDNWQLL